MLGLLLSRNLSADRMDYRQTMRQIRHLIDALIHVLNLSIMKNEVSGRVSQFQFLKICCV